MIYNAVLYMFPLSLTQPKLNILGDNSWSMFFPFLCSDRIFANFHCSGIFPFFRDLLKILVVYRPR